MFPAVIRARVDRIDDDAAMSTQSGNGMRPHPGARRSDRNRAANLCIRGLSGHPLVDADPNSSCAKNQMYLHEAVS